MELGLKVFVLLVCAFDFALGAADGVVTYDCPANTYENNHKLIAFLQGSVYTQYSTAPLGNNEIFKCQFTGSGDNDFCKTTVDNQCCRTFNVTTKVANYQPSNPIAEYFSYLIETAATGCSVVVDELAHLKMISVKVEPLQYCFMLWTCRATRQGVHAFCSAQKISQTLRNWILKEYTRIDSTLVPQVVAQTVDYRNGKCCK